MIYFHLPDFQKNFDLNMIWLEYMKQNPKRFIEDMKVSHIFDSFPIIWNGGRITLGEYSRERAKSVIKEINQRDVKVAFTFTNCLLEKEHLQDPKGNEILKLASGNSIIVNSTLLEDYIRENYPDYSFILSTTRELKSVEQINESLRKDYELVVLDYNMNHDWKSLEQIEDKSRCEFLVNACCKDECPMRGDHYRFISDIQIKYANSEKIEKIDEWECNIGNYNYFTFRNFSNFIGIDEIREKYEPMGFQHFKIEGRGSTTIHLLEQYVQYMVKPEYRDEVRYDILCMLLRRKQ